jgi:AcrR family transcriptional regulator
LQKVLASAEHILATEGFDDFTMAAVAEHAGVSVGGLYRRFEGKDQLLAAVKDRLLGRMEQDLAERLAAAEPNLASVVSAFTYAIADALSGGSAYFPELIRGGSESLTERGARALAETRRLFDVACEPHIGEVRRADPVVALAAVERIITGACIHFSSVYRQAPDEMPWPVFADQLFEMAMAYLLTPDLPRRKLDPARRK